MIPRASQGRWDVDKGFENQMQKGTETRRGETRAGPVPLGSGSGVALPGAQLVLANPSLEEEF